jgi:hypothetical protein
MPRVAGGRQRGAFWAAIVGALVVCAGAGAQQPSSSWLGYGNGPERDGDAAAETAAPTRLFVLPVDGRIIGQILADDGTFYAATTSGEVIAFTADGYVRWRAAVGALAQSCAQLDGYGILGTGVIDGSSGTLYVADAFGRLHALDVDTGAERDGWPVRVFSDFRREVVWGALTLADEAVYVPTASYCDSPSRGGVYRVDLASRQVSPWISVPSSLGGGGGVWGWGGTAYDPGSDALFAVTANALSGGTNTGSDFSESAGYGEHLVELSPDLSVESADHPPDLTSPLDLDFTGSPVVVARSGCGKLLVGADKDDIVYAWREDDIGAGPLWELPLEAFDQADPMLSQLAWSGALDSIYVVTGTQLVRISVADDCSEKVEWQRPLGTHTENGSPTIAGATVWFAVNGDPQLLGYDARTGDRVFDAPLGGTTLEAPTVVDGRLVVGTFNGIVEGFAFGDPPLSAKAPASLPSWAGARDGFQRRVNGVYATENGGHSWHQVYAGPTLVAVRLTKRTGLISVGLDPGRCMCASRQLWTNDAGKTWHETETIGPNFTAGGGGDVYFWSGGTLRRLGSFPRMTASVHLTSHLVTSFTDGTIVDVEPTPTGVAALVSSRVHGQGWDTSPRVVVMTDGVAQTAQLPTVRGRVLATSVHVSWPTLTVTGTDFVADPARQVTWISSDGGLTWTTQ